MHVNGQLIRTTANHPFYVHGKGWVECQLLNRNDLLCSDDGKFVEVESVIDSGDEDIVYNCRVSEYHTYYVSVESCGFSIWAHNANCASQSLPRLKGKSRPEIQGILVRNGYTRTKISASAAQNETWTNPDRSEVLIHPYGNDVAHPFYRSANNAHVHKFSPSGSPLDDAGQILPTRACSAAHIGIPNPPDLPTVRGRPHGSGSGFI